MFAVDGQTPSMKQRDGLSYLLVVLNNLIVFSVNGGGYKDKTSAKLLN